MSIGARAGSWLRGILGRQYERVETSDLENQIGSDTAQRNGQQQIAQEMQVRSTPNSNTSSSTSLAHPAEATSSTPLDLEQQHLLQPDQLQQQQQQQEQGSSQRYEAQEEGGIKGMLSRFGGKKLSQSLSLQRQGSMKKLHPSSSSEYLKQYGNAQCLICFDTLTQEDFKSNKAIILQCNCRGDVAYRHRECAEKWAKIKGNNVCDVCKTPIKNIEPPPPSEEALNGQDDLNIENFRNDQLRNIEQTWVTDFNWFDCVRVAWIVMIVCMVSFDFSLQRAVAAGMLSGLIYLFIRYLLVVIYVRQEQWALFNAINSYVHSLNQRRNDTDNDNTQIRRVNSADTDQLSSPHSSAPSTPRQSDNNRNRV